MINNKRVLGIIPARGGSKGIPRKNIQQILGVPLIAYTIDEGLKSRYIDRLIVSTDDQEIANISLNYHAEVPFIRPRALATDTATSVATLQHAVNSVEKGAARFDYVIELMVTNPLKIARDIDACIEKIEKTAADSVIGVTRLEDHHPARIKKIVDDKLVDFCVQEVNETRRQDLRPHAYIRNGSIYCLDRDILMSASRRYGTENSRPYIFPVERSVNIDTLEDFYVAEQRLIQRQNNPASQ